MERTERSLFSGMINRLRQPPPIQTIRLFKSCLYGIVLLNTVFLLPMADRMWGPESLIMPLDYPHTPLYHLFFMLMRGSMSPYYGIVIVVQVISILIWFSGRWRTLQSVLIFVSTSVLFTSAHLYTTGGHTLIKLLLFYCILIPDQPKSGIQFVLGNLFLLACKVQVAIVYLYAGLFKLHGTYWLNGEALYYVLSLREFSHPILQKGLLDQSFMLKMGAWIGLGYQLLFPVLVWFRQTKMPLLIVGVVFHLLVAFGFGLPDFGLFMIVSYTMFINNNSSGKLLGSVDDVLQRLPLSLKRG